jgi:hypothetical protein
VSGTVGLFASRTFALVTFPEVNVSVPVIVDGVALGAALELLELLQPAAASASRGAAMHIAVIRFISRS